MNLITKYHFTLLHHRAALDYMVSYYPGNLNKWIIILDNEIQSMVDQKIGLIMSAYRIERILHSNRTSRERA